MLRHAGLATRSEILANPTDKEKPGPSEVKPGFDKTTKKCSISKTAPSETEKFRHDAIYGSEADAQMAMKGMTKCKG